VSLGLLFLFSFVVGFGAVVTPGPVSTAIVTESPRRGFITGPLVATGHIALEFVMVVLLALGLSAGLRTQAVITTVSLLGGALLIWMGAGMVVGAARGRRRLPQPGREVKALNNWQLIALGVGGTLLNPFWFSWWLTVGATYLAYPQVQVYGLVGILTFYLGHITGDYLWDCILSGVVGGGSKWITDRLYKWVIVVCGAYLVYLGVVFLITPFRG
jgi:threonine/homoserine/homoserine lactone efflux protein